MLFARISLDLERRSQVNLGHFLVPSCKYYFTYKRLTLPTLASGITILRAGPHRCALARAVQL